MCCIASDADASFGICGCSLVLIGRVCLGTWLVEQNLRQGKRGLDEGAGQTYIYHLLGHWAVQGALEFLFQDFSCQHLDPT